MPDPITNTLPPDYYADRAEERALRKDTNALQREQFALQNTMAEATFFTTLGMNALKEDAQKSLDYLVGWAQNNDKQRENRVASGLGLEAPNVDVESDWRSMTETVNRDREASTRRARSIEGFRGLENPDAEPPLPGETRRLLGT